MEEREEEDLFYGEAVPLTEEQSKKIMDFFSKEEETPVKDERTIEKELLKEKISFLMSLLGSNVPTKDGIKFLIDDDHYSREIIVKDIMDLRKKFVEI